MLSRRRPVTRRNVPPRPGRWSAAPRPLRKTQRSIPGWWKPFVFGPIIFDLAQRLTDKRFPGWLLNASVGVFAFGLLFAFALWLFWRSMETIALRATHEDRALSDAPPGLVEFPVEIVLYDSYGSYGTDRGFVWFEDGLLTFNGAACSFVVAAADLFSRREPNARNLHAGMPGRAIRFRVPGKIFFATLRPLSGLRGLTFDYHLGRFMASVDSSDRPRQWPPLNPYAVQAAIATSLDASATTASRTDCAPSVVRTGP